MTGAIVAGHERQYRRKYGEEFHPHYPNSRAVPDWPAARAIPCRLNALPDHTRLMYKIANQFGRARLPPVQRKMMAAFGGGGAA
jgi:hypothetical protein